MHTKSIGQRIHAKKRASERYGLNLTQNDLIQIVKQIQAGRDAFFLEKQSNRVSIFHVLYGGQSVKVVYDKLRKNVVTFLPWSKR